MQNKTKQNKTKNMNQKQKQKNDSKQKMNHHSPWLKYISIYNERKKERKLASSAMFEVHIHIQKKKEHHNYTLHYIS